MVYNLYGPFDKLRDRMGCFAIWWALRQAQGPYGMLCYLVRSFISLASIRRLVDYSLSFINTSSVRRLLRFSGDDFLDFV